MTLHFVSLDYLDDDKRNELNRLAESGIGPSLYQTTHWAECTNQPLSQARYYLGYQDGELVFAAVTQRRPVSFLPVWLGRVIRGPVAKDFPSLIGGIERLTSAARRQGCLRLRINPYVFGPDKAEIHKELVRLGFRVVPYTMHLYTVDLDLRRALDDIFMSFDQRTRRMIRKAERLGVVSGIATTDDEFEEFLTVFTEMSNRKGMMPADPVHMRAVWHRALKESQFGTLVVSKYEGKVVSGVVLLRHGKRIVYTWGASSANFPDIPKSHLNHWRGIQWAQQQGDWFYDFGGFAPNADKVSPYYGINEFKLGFGNHITSTMEHYQADLFGRVGPFLETVVRRALRH